MGMFDEPYAAAEFFIDEWSERAASRMYDAGITNAEQLAFEDVRERVTARRAS